MAPGGDDATHQYFGEQAVGSEIKLARNAIVPGWSSSPGEAASTLQKLGSGKFGDPTLMQFGKATL